MGLHFWREDGCISFETGRVASSRRSRSVLLFGAVEWQVRMLRSQGGRGALHVRAAPPTPPSCTADTGELRCTPLRLLSHLASVFDLALNVSCLGLRFARESVMKAACLLYLLFLWTNKLGRHCLTRKGWAEQSAASGIVKTDSKDSGHPLDW